LCRLEMSWVFPSHYSRNTLSRPEQVLLVPNPNTMTEYSATYLLNHLYLSIETCCAALN